MARDSQANRSIKTKEWKALRLAILDRDHWLCWVCHRRAGAVDHIVPRSKGGTDHPSNLAAICIGCNSRKKDRAIALTRHTRKW